MSSAGIEDGLCSVYSAQPSETNVSITEALSKEINAINEISDDLAQNEETNVAFDESIYTIPKSETNVTLCEKFIPCNDLKNAVMSQYSTPKSETIVTMREQFKHCPDVRDAVMSKYSAPKSETNVTLREQFIPCQDLKNALLSQYSAPKSETNITMAEGFDHCPNVREAVMSNYTIPKSETNVTLNHILPNLKDLELTELDEKTAVSDLWTSDNSEFAYIQEQLGIADEKTFGIECSNGNITRVVDSNECLLHLDNFQPKSVDLEEIIQKSNTSTIFNPFMNDSSRP